MHLNQLGRSLVLLSSATVLSLASASAWGQTDVNSVPVQASSASQGGAFGQLPDGAAPADLYGTARGSKWIAATKFAGPVLASAPPLVYEGFNFFRGQTAGPVRFFAHIDDVPTGALVDMVSCVYNDTSASNNITFTFQKASQTLSQPGSRSNEIINQFTSSTSDGIRYVNIVMSPPVLIVAIPSLNFTEQYYVTADVASDTSFAGCAVFYTRQITPAPAIASFSDVPTGAQFFKEVEALAASGITSGCTASTYCPENFVTRRQMAAFLARALGLFYPN